jgi:hypothetical protein
MLQYEYARQGLKLGLKLEGELGVIRSSSA